MSLSYDEMVARIAAARKQGSETLDQQYEVELQDAILDFGRSVLNAPSPAGVERWLLLFADLSGLSVEGPAEMTARLRDEDTAAVEQAMLGLDLDRRRIVAEFFRSLDDSDLNISAFNTGPSGPSIASANQRPVLATFIVSDSFDGGRRRVWTGRLAVLDRHGQKVGEYAARTGGFVADYRKRYGPTPPGTYRVDNHRKRHGAPGMEREGVAYSFDLKETDGTPVFGRSAFRIHPDQDPPGTHGCIGVAEGRDRLRECEAKLKAALEAGPFRLAVSYGRPAMA